MLHFPWRWPPSAQCFHQVSCLGLCTSPQCMDGPPRDSLLDCGVGILPGHPPGGVRTNHFPHPLRHIMTTFVCTNLSSFQFNHRFSLPHLFWVITQGGGNAFRPQTTRLICLPIFLPIYLSLLVVPPLIGVPHSLVSLTRWCPTFISLSLVTNQHDNQAIGRSKTLIATGNRSPGAPSSQANNGAKLRSLEKCSESSGSSVPWV